MSGDANGVSVCCGNGVTAGTSVLVASGVAVDGSAVGDALAHPTQGSHAANTMPKIVNALTVTNENACLHETTRDETGMDSDARLASLPISLEL